MPPESTATAGPLPGIRPDRMAARDTAPDGSTTALARSTSRSMAWLIASSSTVITWSAKAWAWARVSSLQRATAMPSAMVARRSRVTGWPALRARRQGRGTGRFDADHLGPGPVRGLERPTDADDPGQQPASPDGHHDGLGVGSLLGQLEADGALAGDHVGIVERGHEDGARVRRECLSQHQRVVHQLPLEANRGAVGSGRFDLRQSRTGGHEDGGRAPGEGGGQSHALGVVAGRGGHDGDPLGELGDAVVGPSDLERAGALLLLRLEQHRPSGQA